MVYFYIITFFFNNNININVNIYLIFPVKIKTIRDYLIIIVKLKKLTGDIFYKTTPVNKIFIKINFYNNIKQF